MPYATKDAQGDAVHEFNHSMKGEALLDIELRRTFGDDVHRDYRHNPTAQKMGYDYLLRWSNDNVAYLLSVDDKADDWLSKTGNVSLELFTLSPRRTISDGWLMYSMAHSLRYASMGTKEVLILPLDEVRAYVLPRLKEFDTVGVVNARGEDLSHVTFNALVPAKALLQNCSNARIVMLEGATPQLSVGFEDRVTEPQALLTSWQGQSKYSKAKPGLSADAIQARLLANRYRARQAAYLEQCRLPRGVHLQLEMAT